MGPTAVEREHVLPAGEMKMFLSPCLRHPPQPALPQPPSRNGIDGARHWDENYFTVSGAIKTKLICHIPRNCTPFPCFNIPLHVCSVVEEAFFVCVVFGRRSSIRRDAHFVYRPPSTPEMGLSSLLFFEVLEPCCANGNAVYLDLYALVLAGCDQKYNIC